MTIDNLKVGTQFSDVVEVVPEPSTAALLGCFAALHLFFAADANLLRSQPKGAA